MNPLPSYLLPDTADTRDDVLHLGGVNLLDIAAEFGTPVFVYDEAHLEARCAEAVAAFPGGVAFASKAFLCKAMAKIATQAGMKIDVASGGEIHVAVSAGVSPKNLVFHGNNKSHAELATAIEIGVGTIVVDSFDEIDRIEEIVKECGSHPVRCLIRVTPGIEAHTHEYIITGHDDSKFGFGLSSGLAQKAIERMISSPAISLEGIHAHIGSQIFDTASFEKEVAVLAPFVLEHDLPEFCVGGGLGIPYVTGESAPTISEWGQMIHKAVKAAGLPDSLKVTAEPGRSIVGPASITLYTVGTIKELPDIRTYMSVDGGLIDNPRPALYGSGYEAFLPRSPEANRPRVVTIVGKHCESGDILVRNAHLPQDTQVGDIVATPVTGAYGYAMGSNYNKMGRPPVVFVKDGDARLVIRRETFDDLLRLDV